MHVSDHSPEEIAAALKAAEKEAKGLEGRRKKLAVRQDRLAREQRELKQETDANRQAREMLDAVRLLLVPPGPVWERRATLAELRLHARQTDSKREAESLKADIAKREEELKAECLHPFVVDAPAYRGYSIGGDDPSEPGERFCAVCNLHEKEYATWQGEEAGFRRLVEAEHRLFGPGRRDQIREVRQRFLEITEFKDFIAALTPERLLRFLASLKRPTP